ncbi:MAG: hypothetical protein JWM18_3844 [Chloroflexi bacterium]|jgi:hypothetical protein|nr:hypothetical protein [Chloroflexota bacterium]
MALMAATADPVPDPIDEELERLLEHPVVRERLDDYERRRAEGRLGEGIPHSEVRRRLGLPPQEPEPPPNDA